MKKIKQILALSGVFLLLGLYVITFVMALTDNTETMQFFKASLFATFVVPVLIWAYMFIYRLTRKEDKSGKSQRSEKASDTK